MMALPTSAEVSISARWRDTRSPIDDGGDYFRRREQGAELAQLRWGFPPARRGRVVPLRRDNPPSAHICFEWSRRCNRRTKCPAIRPAACTKAKQGVIDTLGIGGVSEARRQ